MPRKTARSRNGGDGERKNRGNGRDRPTGQGKDKERRKGRRTGARRKTGSGREKSTVGGERNRVPGFLWERKCRLDSALTTSGTVTPEDWIQHSGEWTRPTWTCASSRR